MNVIRILCGISLIVLWNIASNSAQNLPASICPEFFEYLSFNQQFIGHLSIRLDPQYEVNVLVVEFSQRGVYQWSYVGTLSLLDDQETTRINLRIGQPINYRVDFPIPTSPPKLTKIVLNDVTLCSAPPYFRPRTAISLMHSLSSTTTPLLFTPGAPSPPNIAGQFQPNQFPRGQQTDYNIVDLVPETATPTIQTQIANDIGRRGTLQNQLVPQRGIVREFTPVGSINNVREFNPVGSINNVREFTPVGTANNVRTGNNVGTVNSAQNDIACGRERAITTPLIFQGRPLERGQLPWLVGLFDRQSDNGLTFFCGGSLISSGTVLTAAHCFLLPGREIPATRTVVSLGRNSIDLISDGELRDVSQLLVHEDFKLSQYSQPDMALIKLAVKVTFNDYIVPICLWNDNFPLNLPAGYKAYVAGWGADETGNTNTKLSKISDTDIITEATCRLELPGDLVQPSIICAKKSGAGPCASDGGGGLMLRENNVWVLRGVISSGLRINNTCDLSRPAIYTDVAKQIAWVRQNMWN